MPKDFVEGHTVRRFDGELANLNLLVLEMGGLVLAQCRGALQALRAGDLAAAGVIIEREDQVDALELKLDENIWWLVSKRSPVGRDLRMVVAVSKAVTDLERVGDEAARVAHAVRALHGEQAARKPSAKLLRDVQAMGAIVHGLLEDAVALYDELDLEGAESLLARYAALDDEFQAGVRRVSTFLIEDARNVGHVVEVVMAMRALDRIGDHARNLAEYIVYLVRGEDIRHPQVRER